MTTWTSLAMVLGPALLVVVSTLLRRLLGVRGFSAGGDVALLLLGVDLAIPYSEIATVTVTVPDGSLGSEAVPINLITSWLILYGFIALMICVAIGERALSLQGMSSGEINAYLGGDRSMSARTMRWFVAHPGPAIFLSWIALTPIIAANIAMLFWQE